MSVAQAADSYVYGDCTYGVALMVPGIATDMGNATDWIDGAKRHGYPVTSTPTVGSIVVYSAGSNYTRFGHVAVVEAINVQTTSRVGFAKRFTVREMNFNSWNGWDERVSDMTDVKGFIIPPGFTGTFPQSGGECSTFSWNIAGSAICMDGVVGGLAIAGGLIVGIVGLVLLVIAVRQTAGGRAVVESANAVQQPVRAVQERPRFGTQADSQRRVATARARATMRRTDRLQRERENEPLQPMGTVRKSHIGAGSRGGKRR